LKISAFYLGNCEVSKDFDPSTTLKKSEYLEIDAFITSKINE